MFGPKFYKVSAALVGVGSCALIAHQGNLKQKVTPAWLNAASTEQGYQFEDLTKSFKPWERNWDKREPTGKDSPKPTASRHIILIRHGQYKLAGANDSEKTLTKLGREQADLTGRRLKVLGLDISKIHESTMTRAQETSSILQKYLADAEVLTTDLLREGAPIPPEPSHSAWQPTDDEFFTEGARIEAAFRKFFHRASPRQEKDSVEVLVCHANVIRYMACRALQYPPEGWLRIGLRHCSITWITVRPSGHVTLRCLGDAGHMPPEKLTFN